jgi:glycosyltransferase involved in cell wall biosynthesis
MRVVLFFTFGVSLESWSKHGLFPREIRLYQELVKRGVEVVLVTYGDESDRRWSSQLGAIKIAPFYEQRRRPKNKLFRLIHSLVLPWVFRDLIRQADILKTNQIWGGWNAVVAKWLWKKPLLVRCGYEPYLFASERSPTKIGLFFHRAYSWITYRNGDFIHIATDEDADFVEKFYAINRKNIKVMPNWIDTDYFRPSDRARVPTEILAVGRLEAQKNIGLLIEAIYDSDYKLTIIGVGPEREMLKIFAKRLNVDVEFLDVIPNNLLLEYYQRFSMYVLCSRYEGNPKSLLEAMACGMAVIGTNVRGIRSIIQDRRNGMLCEENAESLRNAIDELVNDTRLRRNISEGARKSAEVQCSLARYVENELKTYMSVITRTSA